MGDNPDVGGARRGCPEGDIPPRSMSGLSKRGPNISKRRGHGVASTRASVWAWYLKVLDPQPGATSETYEVPVTNESGIRVISPGEPPGQH